VLFLIFPSFFLAIGLRQRNFNELAWLTGLVRMDKLGKERAF